MVIKYNKIWLTKDKYIYRSSLGEHWFLKKFLVLYKYFLVNRNKIDKKLLQEITLIFDNFINAYEEGKVKQDCKNYFYSPVDIRKYNDLIDFEKFNNSIDLDDAARKYYLVYLMGMGMQSGIKKMIGQLLYSNKNITVLDILKNIPIIKNRAIKDKIEKGKKIRSAEDSDLTIFSDFHAEIRNYRQLLSYRGILPLEDDGYELNEVSNLICESDPILLMSIWEHQKIKLRYNNPFTRTTHENNIKNNYVESKDFLDFSVSPYLGLINVMYELNKKYNSDYLSFDEYKLFICREAPFSLDIVVNKIINFRASTQVERELFISQYNARPKTRNFSKKVPKSESDDFLKELSNLIYGLFEYEYIKSNKNYKTFLIYKDRKIIIEDKILFNKFASFLTKLNSNILSKYDSFYKDISLFCILKLIDEVANHSSDDYNYVKKLEDIKKEFSKRISQDINSFYNITFRNWNNYISTIDQELLIMCYSFICAIQKDNGNLISKASNLINVQKALVNISGYTEKSLVDFITHSIKLFDSLEAWDISLFSKLLPLYEVQTQGDIGNEVDNLLRIESFSEIKNNLLKQQSNLLYIFDKNNNSRHRKRDQAMMILTLKKRMNDCLVMEETRPEFPIGNCDSCNNPFVLGEPECHHLIPFEIYGPDLPLNYSFLCNKCHDVFTHNTRSIERTNIIFNLKLKGIIRKKYFEMMIESGRVTHSHLNFLYRESYINTVDFLELLKLVKTAKFEFDKFDTLVRKTSPSKNRWNRAMKLVYYNRQYHQLVMERKDPTYQTNRCDSCLTHFKEEEPECHHLIPKRIYGPESPFNYIYLCKECHSDITFDSSRKKQVYTNLKNNGFILIENIKQMIVNEDINKEHIDFLLNESIISENESGHLSDLISIANTFRRKL